jgi:hypothetical protein
MTVEYKVLDWCLDYKIGTDGSVWTLRVYRGRGCHSSFKVTDEWHRVESKPRGVRKPYHRIRINGKRYALHVLMLEVFVGPRPLGAEACHFPDPDQNNNSIDNLKWGSHQENQKHRELHRTSNVGESNGQSRFTDDDIAEMRRLYALGETQSSIRMQFNASASTVSSVVRGLTRKRSTIR